MATNKQAKDEDREPFLRLDLGASDDALDCGCEIRRVPESDDVEVFLCTAHLGGQAQAHLAELAECKVEDLDERIEALRVIENDAKDAIGYLKPFTEEEVSAEYMDDVDAHASAARDLLNTRSEGEILGEKMLELCGLTLTEWQLGCYDTYYEIRFNPVEFLVDRLRALAPHKLALDPNGDSSDPPLSEKTLERIAKGVKRYVPTPVTATINGEKYAVVDIEVRTPAGIVPARKTPRKKKTTDAPPITESARTEMPPGFSEHHDRTINCPHRQISVCPDCVKAHPEIVEMFGIYYWVPAPDERKQMRTTKKEKRRK